MHGTLTHVPRTRNYPRLSQHDFAVGCDAAYLPWQGSHPFRAATQRFPNGVTAFERGPGRIPSNRILSKVAREFIRVGSRTRFYELSNQGDALKTLQD